MSDTLSSRIEEAKRARREGRLADAQSSYEDAVLICRDQGDASKLAHTVRHLGDVQREAERFEVAERSYEEALSLYRAQERTPPLELANALRGMALLKEKLGEIEAAAAMWQEACDHYSSVHVEAGVSECSTHLARLKP